MTRRLLRVPGLGWTRFVDERAMKREEPPELHIQGELARVNRKEAIERMMWESKEKGMADAYVVNIQGGNKSKLERVREIQDEPGKKSCQSFESIDLCLSMICLIGMFTPQEWHLFPINLPNEGKAWSHCKHLSIKGDLCSGHCLIQGNSYREL